MFRYSWMRMLKHLCKDLFTVPTVQRGNWQYCWNILKYWKNIELLESTSAKATVYGAESLNFHWTPLMYCIYVCVCVLPPAIIFDACCHGYTPLLCIDIPSFLLPTRHFLWPAGNERERERDHCNHTALQSWLSWSEACRCVKEPRWLSVDKKTTSTCTTKMKLFFFQVANVDEKKGSLKTWVYSFSISVW